MLVVLNRILVACLRCGKGRVTGQLSQESVAATASVLSLSDTDNTKSVSPSRGLCYDLPSVTAAGQRSKRTEKSAGEGRTLFTKMHLRSKPGLDHFSLPTAYSSIQII